MSKPNFLEFENPIHIVWRKGTNDDPYKDRIDISVVVNQRIQLLEIPDSLHRVRIAGFKEINYEIFNQRLLADDEFYCDYSNGFVFVSKRWEAETLSVVYKGRGMLIYPSSRIYHYDQNNNIQGTMSDIIEESIRLLTEFNNDIVDLESLRENVIVAINQTHQATAMANGATEEAENAIERMDEAFYTTRLVYKPYVETYLDLLDEYEYPEVGWTVQVYETGVRYRFNGNDWIPIDLFGGNLPTVNEQVDGLMSSEDYIKLKELTPLANNKTIVIVTGVELFGGIQNIVIPFKDFGTIEEISAVGTNDIAETVFTIEKSVNMEVWTDVLSSPVTIPENSFFNDNNHVISLTEVNAGDIFRMNVIESGSAKNVTVQIKIKIKEEM